MKFKRILVKFLINKFFSCTRFFEIKRKLLIFAGIEVGKDTKVVGPLDFGNNIKIKVGKSCWIGKNISFDGDGEVIIGDNVDIAPHVVIATGGHEIGDFKRRAGNGIINRIKIGDGVWIGTRTTIINNVVINDSSVIAAGSVVNKSIAKDSLYVGVPAKLKKELT